MQLRDRFIVAPPAGRPPTLAAAAADAGAYALADTTQSTGETVLETVPREACVVRATLDTPPIEGVPLAVLSTWSIEHADIPELRRSIQAWQAAGVPVGVEVRDRAEGRRAKQAGADFLVARGAEGPGRVSPRSNLVLLPALAELDLPLIAWGGAGPNATAALLVHADMVVLDHQLALLPEGGLDDAWRTALDAFDGSDVRQLGSTLGEPVHVHARIADEHVHELWETEQADERGPRERRAWLQAELDASLSGFDGAPGEGLIPLGHDAAHASFFSRFDDLEAALAFLEDRIEQQLGDFELTEGSPLAQEHGTRYPVVQGAMANVSEVPPFAKAVADAGGLPFLAFAALREHWAEDALTGTIDALDEDQSFGCGIIGLDVNAKKRDAHVRLIKEHQPPYALIAAGTAEQALDLDRAGVDTYLHTPSRAIVEQALEMGLTRVVVEGNECGGHIGKLPSLVLWDLALQAVERLGPADVLLAGGISDDATAAMAGTLAAGVPEARVGVLMGTAYLATREIVETGAIPATYQRLVLASKDTDVTGDTVGIRARSAPTPFTERITELERELVREGKDVHERKEVLESENLGATRTAARGVKRAEDGTYHDVPEDEQLADGNYLMGQGAELLEDTYTIEELHERVTTHAADVVRTATDRLSTHQPPLSAPTARTTEANDGLKDRAVAVVGLGCVLPDAPAVDAFWTNLLEQRVSIRELPPSRWPIDPKAHLRTDGSASDDGTYTLLGAFIDDDTFSFDPVEHRIPPTVAEQMDDSQKWAITATQQALEDAGLIDAPGRDRWGVILGNALGGEQRVWTERRLALNELEASIGDGDLDAAESERLRERVQTMRDKLPAITEDTMPGELANVIAGRVCSVFDIGGPARTVDAACASSLAAAQEAVNLLREGTIDVAVTGGVDRSMDPAAYSKFSAIGALSPEGSFPFDERASGFVMGEGCAILVLKRLSDAIENGDRVYAVIEGVGASSDGKGKGITAPNPSGQIRAIQAALDDAGWEPDTIELVEAHGTGTPVGDPAEAETLESILSGVEPGSVGLGSVKSNIGHLKAAAGAAGLLKAVLAIHHGTQPPTVHEQPTSEVDWEKSPLRLVEEPTPWTSEARRVGVSAFGFGGTNAHVLLGAPAAAPREEGVPSALPDGQRLGLRLISGTSKEAVAQTLEEPEDAWTFEPSDPVRLALTSDAERSTARKALAGELPPELALSQGVACVLEGDAPSPTGDDAKLAMVFPGQGSQYPGMVLELAERFEAANEVLAEADQVLTPLLGHSLTSVLELEGEEGAKALTATEICQPAVLTCDIAVLRVLEELGVEPDVVAGHSLGEYAALVAAGVLSFEDALHAVSARGQEMADVEVDDPGGLVALRTDRDGAQALIEGLDAWPANVNGPEQTVVAGTTPALETLIARAEEQGIQASQLPVSAAFHSPIVEPATEPLLRVLERLPVDRPEIPVIANATGEPYPDDPAEIRELLARQVASPVEWVATMDRFVDMGVGLVVEAGPKRALSGLAMANLEHVPAVPTLHPRTGEVATFERALAVLAAAGRLEVPSTEPTPVPEGQVTQRPRRPTPQTSQRGREGTTKPQRERAGTAKPQRAVANDRQVVVTGVSLGLPGRSDPFGEGNVDALLDGENHIDPVPGAQRERMANMGITRLVKDESTGPRMEPIESPDEVVQLAGRIGDPDLHSYGVEEDWLDGADATARLAVAAALEALSDAHIPLVREQRTTSTGATLEDGWVLPEPIQGETGVILASAFPGYDSLLGAINGGELGSVPASPESSAATKNGRLTGFLADLIPEIEDKRTRQRALDLLIEHSSGTAASPSPHSVPPAEGGPTLPREREFPRDLLFRALAFGHAQVAQLLRARGPNLQVNAACASTTSAIALAQDWIEQGRCERVIVVGADVAGNEHLLPLVGAGFLSAGAASTADRVEEAALPFDERRHGMLIGSGAVGLVLETEQAASDRGVTPLARLVGAHVANSAFHGARLDPGHVAEQTQSFLSRASEGLDVPADELASELVFVSHEPATPARGGSAQAEVDALRAGLGDHASDVLITNTKGLTGHAMGAGIEDGIAVELLRRGRAPPVANLRKVDPAFQDLAFSQGGELDRRFSLRFAAGFGSQVAMALFERGAPVPGALDEAAFERWVGSAIGPDVRVGTQDRLLRATTTDPTAQEPASPAASTNGGSAREPSEPVSEPAPAASAPTPDVTELLVELVSERTGYPTDVIDPEMDLEGDLGVDTVKQAEVLAQARKRLDIPPIEGLSLSDVPTIEQAAALLAEHTGAGGSADVAETSTRSSTASTAPADDGEADQPARPAGSPNVTELLVELVSERTGYPTDVIDPEMDLEGDLGVDTVKQAEVLAQARKRLDIPPIEGLSLSDVPTIQDAANLLAQHTDGAATTEGQPSTGSEQGSDGEAPGIDGTEDRGDMPVLELAAGSASPAEPLAQGTRVQLRGSTSESFEAALSDAGATLVDDEPDLVAFVLETLELDPDELTGLLTDLQAVPADARLVLLAEAQAPAAPGLAPLCSTLNQEDRRARAILLEDPVPPERVALEVLADTTESVHLSSDDRRTQRLRRAELEGSGAVELPEDAVVLALGGLGAAVRPCLQALADERSLRLVVVGRSAIQDPGFDPEDEAAIEALREELLDEARDSDGPVRPAEIEAEVQTRIKHARRASALAELEAHAEVRYERCDATDPAGLRALVERVRAEVGEPSLVVHGAGVERSRAFDAKDADEMRTVLAPKLVPAKILTELLPDAHHVAFGSIAGVLGNPGQADYALANGCLTGAMREAGGTVIHWTAWDATGGMADDETVRKVLDERGVRFLEPEEGARRFVQAGLRPAAWLVADVDPDDPLVATEHGARLVLSGEEDWLVDHSVGPRPLVPGVRHLESFLETARRVRSEPIHRISQARFRRPVWVDEPVEAEIVLDGGQARTELDGKRMAWATLGPLEGVKPIELPTPPEDAWSPERIYERLFHGPSFQVLTSADPTPERVVATADLGTGGGAPWAMALEACMQAAGLSHAAEDEGVLPVGLEELEIGPAPTTGEALVVAERVSGDLLGGTWDATCFVDGEPVLVARAIRLRSTFGTARWIDTFTQLEGEDGIQLQVLPVGIHDPRDPRAKREAEHEAGRDAASRVLERVHGQDVALEANDDGAPRPVGAPGGVSITHGHGLAVAAAHPKIEQLGIDIERVETRSRAWHEDVLTEEERGVVAHRGDDPEAVATVLWTLKEAASKALGTGLSVPVKSLEVVDLDDGTARVRTPEGTLEARWVIDGELAASLVWLPGSA